MAETELLRIVDAAIRRTVRLDVTSCPWCLMMAGGDLALIASHGRRHNAG